MADRFRFTVRLIDGPTRPDRSRSPRCGSGVVLVAEATTGNDVVGLARAELCTCADGNATAWIDDVRVEPEWHGHGLPRRLVTELLQDLRGRGATEVFTLVHRADASLAPFFQQLGFRERPYACLGRSLRS